MRMSASSGEPRTLLNALRPMLGLSGDIKTPQEVLRIISLMRDAEKLMSRCIYINILTATIDMSQENEHSCETLEKFIAAGGWSILNKWLTDAKKNDDFFVMLEVLKVLKDLPVSVDTLKQGTAGKIVKQLSKSENGDIRKVSTDILRQWMNLVRTKSENQKIKQNGAPANSMGANAHGNNERESESSKSGKRMRENQSSPQPEKKTKTLAEVKSGISQKPVSKTKIIPPQPKPAAMESTGFMNALASAAAPVQVRKRKRTTATAAKTATTSTTSTSNGSTANTKANYTGILDEIMSSQSQTHGLEDREHVSKEGASESTNKAGPSPVSSPRHTPSALEDSSEPGNDKDLNTDKENSPTSSAQGSETTQVEGSDAEGEKSVKKSKKGKKVTWASDEKMNTYHFFEMDEDERALVRHPVNFIDAQHMEMKRERELVEQAKRLSDDRMNEKLKWYRPRKIERKTNMDIGARSEQKLIQSDRETSILADIFLTKSSLPDSAAEPDPDVDKIERGEPKVIPHDEKGTTHLPDKTPPLGIAGVQLPAALASLFSSGAGSTVKTVPTQAAQGTQLSVQSLLDKLMKSSAGAAPATDTLTQLLSAQKQQQQQQQQQQLPQQHPVGPILPTALQQILEPLQHKMTGPIPRGPGVPAGQGLLGAAPGDMTGTLNMTAPGLPFGPRGPHVPVNRPEALMRFSDPRGPRQGHPMGPHFPGPEGLGPRHRGPLLMRMQRPPGPGRGLPSGPRPLLPELNRQQEEIFEEFPELCEQEGDYPENALSPMRGRGRGIARGRGRGRGRGVPLCRHFASWRGCNRGNNCFFLHTSINGPPL